MPVLYDQFGRPIEPIKKPDTRTIAAMAIRDRWSTYPSQGLTPVKLASILKQADYGDVRQQAELFEEMEEKDAHIGSQFQTRKLATVGLNYEIIPSKEGGDKAKKTAELIEQFIDEFTGWDDAVLDILDALPKGYSMSQIFWEASEGQARITGIEWYHPKKITFWDSLVPRIITDDQPIDGVEPPPWKTIYHRYKARSGYDTRAGIMRVCAWMYLFKNYDIKDWVAFAEIYGQPLRLGKYQPGSSSDEKDALLTALRSLGTDAAGVISKNTEIEFVTANEKSGSMNIYETLANFCDAQMSKAILGQTLTSSAGEGGSGSYALGRVHDEVRQDLMEFDSKALSRTINSQLIVPLIGFNFGWDAPMPQFRLKSEPPEDTEKVSRVYQVLSEMGFDISQEHISQRFGVPMAQKGETPLSRPASISPFGAKVYPEIHAGRKTKRRSVSGKDSDTQAGAPRIIDGMDVAMAAEEKQDRAVREMIAPVLAELRRAASYDEMLEKLYGLFGDFDSRVLEEILTRGMMFSALAGAAGAQDEEGGD